MSDDTDLLIRRAGVITPIGLGLGETASSARARVARLGEIAWLDRRRQPYIAGTVPDDALEPLVPPLAGAVTARESRMLRLAQAALEETLGVGAWLEPGRPPAASGPVPLLLALPESDQGVSPARFLDRLDQQAPGLIDRARSVAAPRGRAAGLMALREAGTRLRRGDAQAVLVGGVDCLVDLAVLARLDRAGRLRTELNSDGLTPGEGAGFVLLTRGDGHAGDDAPPLAALRAVHHAVEPGHLHAQAPYLGEGLAQAVGGLIDGAELPGPVASVYLSFNGERYWAREFGVARLRRAAAFADDARIEHPAECFGDLGAAHGAVLLALAAHALHHGHRPSPGLVCAASDHGDRAAALLLRHEPATAVARRHAPALVA